MSNQLDPRILSKLRAFARRRRNLIIIRGICSALAMLLATMMLVALIDWVFVLPDELRWALSAAAYLAVIIVEWRTCIRQLTHAPNSRELARLIEHAEPKLREDLLSAVELGSRGDEKIFDSEQFRGLLQTDVANRVEGMQVDRLLPANLLKRYIGVALALSIVMVIAFIGTGFQLRTLMQRALFPWMNLDRVSATKVAIIAPNPAEMTVPNGDTLPLEVKLSGRLASKAVLEVFTPNGKREVVPLTATGPDRFAGTVQVGREDVRYRVRAGDAITRKYLLDAEPRPLVVQFEKTFTPPAYTKMAPSTKREENGDVVGLEGSEVELKLATNVPVERGELRLEQGKANSVIPLAPGKDGRLGAKVPLKLSGTYRVHLVAAKTAFENKFSPEYELRAEADLVPGVTLDEPLTDLIVPANDVVDFTGTATDDLSVAKLAQHFRINEGRWAEVPVAIKAGPKVPFHHRWDLLSQGVKAGDIITAKIVATDLKGNTGESRPIQISVTAAGFEMKRFAALDAHRALADALKAWREASEALAKVSGETRQRVESTGDNDGTRASQLTIFAEAYKEFEQRHGDVLAALSTALRAAQAGHESADLVLLGRLLSKTEAGTARLSKVGNEVAAAHLAAPFAKTLVREGDDAVNRATQRARAAEEGFRTLLTAEELDILAENAQVLHREQTRLVQLAKKSGNDAAKWTPLNTRLRVLLVEAKSLEEGFTKAGAKGGASNERAKQLGNAIRPAREALEKLLAEKGASPAALTPTLNLAKSIEDGMRGILELKTELGSKPVEAARAMRTEVQPTWQNVDAHRTDLKTLAGNGQLVPEARELLIGGRWSARADLFKTHGDLEEIRPASDAAFVGDVRSTSVALHGLQALAPTDGAEKTDAKLTQLDFAFRLLEGGHDLQEILDGLTHLSSNERWQIVSPRARTVNPRDWNWLEGRLRLAPEELGKLSLVDEPVVKAIGGAQKILTDAQKHAAWAHLAREMGERKQTKRDPVSARQDADLLAAEVKRALALLRPHMNAARQQIAQLAPKLSELAAALAKEAEQLKEETTKQEEAAKEKPPEEAKAEAEKALAKQEKLSDKLEPLKDLLRADANQQNILEEAQRERARDADDALAMLKEPPPKAESALQDAATAETPSAQQEALAQAAEQQEKLEQSLNQIAEHFEKLEKGEDPTETRTAMREAEQELGIKDQLDAQFAKAQELAEMAQKSPQELLAQLEKALPKNPLMQQELSTIAQSVLAEAEAKLEQASGQENQVAAEVAKEAQHGEQGSPKEAAAKAQEAAKQAVQAAEAAKTAANNAVQTAKQAGNEKAMTEARQARQEATEAVQAAQQAAQSAEQMAKATDPKQAAQAAQQTAQQASKAAEMAEKAATDAGEAQSAAEAAAQAPGDKQAQNQQVAQQSGEAMKAAAQAADAAEQAQAAAESVQAAMAENAPAPGQPQAAPDPSAPQPSPAAPMPSAKLAQAAQKQDPIAEMAGEAGADVARAGRHEERLQNQAAGEQLQQLGAEIAETAMAEVSAAKEALQNASAAGEAQAPVNAAKTELAAELAQLQAAAEGGQTPSEGGTPPSGAEPAGTPPAGTPPSGTPPAGTPPSGSPAEMADAGQPPAGQPGEAGSPPPSPGEGAGEPPQGGQPESGSPAQTAQAGSPQPGQPPAGSPQPGEAPAGDAASGEMPAGGSPSGDLASLAATPQEQQAMARALDALDAALNSPSPTGESPTAGEPGSEPGQGQPSDAPPAPGEPGQPGQPGQPGEQPGQPGQSGQPGQPTLAQAAMAAAAQAAQAAMRAQRSEDVSPTPAGFKSQGDQQEKSEGGALAEAPDEGYGAVPAAAALKAGEWGKLPKKIAEQLTKGQQEGVAPEYRAQVQTYYRVIAERAKKP